MLCAANVYEAHEAMIVYRVYDGTTPPDPSKAKKMGGFWSFERPRGTAQQYRTEYAICPIWNDLARLVTCTIRPKTRFLVGTGQSVDEATCGGGLSFEASAVNQVFLPYKEGTKQLPIDEANCKDEPMQWSTPLDVPVRGPVRRHQVSAPRS